MFFSGSDCGPDLCGPPPSPQTSLGLVLSLSPFLATFALVSALAARRLFPHLSLAHARRHDGDDHFLPASAPVALQQAHAEHAARSPRRRASAAAFAATLGLAAVLAELILAEVSDLIGQEARAAALRLTVPSLLVLLVGAVPFLEIQSLVAGAGWSFRRAKDGRIPRVAWALQLLVFGGWLCVFWSVGRAVPASAAWGGNDYSYYLSGRHLSGEGNGDGDGDGEWSFDSTGMTIGRASVRSEAAASDVLTRGGLARACLERIGVIGITLMGLLSGFASVSNPWHAFVDNRLYRRRPITDADIARKQAGLDAASEMLHSKRHRLQMLQKKVAAAAALDEGTTSTSSSGIVGKMFGSLKNIGGGGGGDIGEIKALRLEISGLETMESNLSSALSSLKTQQAAHARDGTALGLLLSLPNYVFSIYCVYRILATTLATFRRMYSPAASFSSSDPISRFLGLLAKHWDPKMDQIAWARQISFLLSGVILAASAGSVLQTSHLFAKWAPGLLYQARANLALATGQVAATYVISAGLLLRSNLPKDVGRSVGDALEGALEPRFADRWFEGWFLVASAGTAVGIWVGRKLGSGARAGEWDEWEDYEGEEMGQKRS